ncbi:MerR family transcriptional regulator [Actinomyces wuliandei]|uniref:MerR family transcriptional regulator n=1 Tax=Actinomyces wuliandei TaxID=2057743 RepID=UPI001FA96CB4|nr:MerR family transcriptional regulator [Actinomyces wuliandei]
MPRHVMMTVGEVAVLLRVTVRTLHHWDDVGLVRPSRRSRAGYRLYSSRDRQRLEQVLVYREVGVPLALIGRLLDAPHTEVLAHLARQRGHLEERVRQLSRSLSVIDSMMERTEAMKEAMKKERNAEEEPQRLPEDMRAAVAGLWGHFWGPAWDPAHAYEAERWWGDIWQWAQAAHRQASMTWRDWEQACQESEALETELVEAMRRGVVPGSPEACALAERHRSDLSRWFDVSVSHQVLITRLYEKDERLRRHYDHRAPGLATWLRQVVEARARSQGLDPETARWSQGCGG